MSTSISRLNSPIVNERILCCAILDTDNDAICYQLTSAFLRHFQPIQTPLPASIIKNGKWEALEVLNGTLE